jgi:hypothetical protein
VDIIDMLPATDNTILFMRISTDGGSTYKASTDYEYIVIEGSSGSTSVSAVQAEAANEMYISGSASGGEKIGNTTANAYNGVITFTEPDSTAKYFTVSGEFQQTNAERIITGRCGGMYTTATDDVDAIRFIMDSGNIASGTFNLYGIKK